MTFLLLVLAYAAGLALAGSLIVTAYRVASRWLEDARIRRTLRLRFPGLR